MNDTWSLNPDRAYIGELKRAGGSNLKKCYQCATCSSVCPLSTDSRPFPRKQILQAQWGMADRLVGDPAVWLCHDCGECAVRCPRGVNPADVMGAIRGAAIKRLAFPRLMVRADTPTGLAFVIAVSAALALGAMKVSHAGRTVGFTFEALFPEDRLEALFFAITGWAIVSLAVGGARFARALREYGSRIPAISDLIPVLAEALAHRRFAACGAGAGRRVGHLLVLSGFAGLGLVSAIEGVGYHLGVIQTPLPLFSPLKIFANCCALALVGGAGTLVWSRLRDRADRAAGAFSDWTLLFLLGGAALTGLASELLRLAHGEAMFGVYFAHLTLVLALLLTACGTKLSHVLYRVMAMMATWREPESADAANS
jgi:quinone-modifying oxidoreductase subunit QmoC